MRGQFPDDGNDADPLEDMMRTDELERLLRQADPWPGDIPSYLTRDVATAVVADHGDAERARMRRRVKIGSIAAAALLVGVPTAAVAGYQLAAQTGLFGAHGMSEEDTSEWIDVCASDFPEYFATLPTPKDAAPDGTPGRRPEN